MPSRSVLSSISTSSCDRAPEERAALKNGSNAGDTRTPDATMIHVRLCRMLNMSRRRTRELRGRIGRAKRKKPAAVATGFTEFQRSYFPS